MARYNYKDLLGEKQFLDVQRRSRELGGTDIQSIEWQDKMVVFTTYGLTGVWTQRVKLTDIDFRTVPTLKWSELRRVTLNTGVKVSCDCPSFLFNGFKYIAATEGYGLEQEGRAPNIRNPDLKGKVCKHLFSVFTVWPFIINAIAGSLRGEIIERAGIREWVKTNTSNLSIEEELTQNYMKQFNQITQKIR